MKVIGYLRVSTVEQSYGIEAQRNAIAAQAELRGWEVEWIADQGRSGKDIDKLGITLALAMLKRGEADALVVSKRDRLSRSLADFARVLETAGKRWGIVSLDLGLDTTTSTGQLVASIMAAVSQWERQIIGQRTKEGLAVARANGVVLGAPVLADDETKQRIADEFERGRSLAAIARGLNDDLIPVASRGRRLYPSSVQAVLRSEKVPSRSAVWLLTHWTAWLVGHLISVSFMTQALAAYGAPAGVYVVLWGLLVIHLGLYGIALPGRVAGPTDASRLHRERVSPQLISDRGDTAAVAAAPMSGGASLAPDLALGGAIATEATVGAIELNLLLTANSGTMYLMARAKKHRDDKPEIGLVLRALGPMSSWLRKRWLLAIATFIGAIISVLAPFLLTDPGWNPFRIIVGVATAVAIILDRVADRYETKLADLTFRESERSAEKAVENVNIFISEALEAMFLSGTAREQAIRSLKRTLVRCAAACVGDGSRASYYPMRRGDGGTRVLERPSHATEHGRFDKPDRPFIEAEDPDHEVWTILDRSDEEPEVRSKPEKVYGIDWNKKKYKTFYSVPIKADMVQFGFLSVNNAKVGAIGGPQRAAILSMARVYALVISGFKGPLFLNTQASFHTMSVVAPTLSGITEGVEQ